MPFHKMWHSQQHHQGHEQKRELQLTEQDWTTMCTMSATRTKQGQLIVDAAESGKNWLGFETNDVDTKTKAPLIV